MSDGERLGLAVMEVASLRGWLENRVIPLDYCDVERDEVLGRVGVLGAVIWDAERAVFGRWS